MAEDHPLDHPDARTAVITSVSSGGSLADAGAAAGVTKTRLSRYLKAHADFGLEVAAARKRAEIIAHHAPRMLACPPTSSPPASAAYPDPSSPEGREKLFRLLWDHAEDGSSKGCPKACDVLAQLAFAPELLALKAKAKREAAQLEAKGAGSELPVVIRVPIRRQPNSAVIEAEVVDPGETRH